MNIQSIARRLAAFATAAVVCIGLSSNASAQIAIDECGYIAAQPFGGCSTLWVSEVTGNVYQDNTGTGFGGAFLGDRIRCVGTYNVFCPTFCAVNGCFVTLTVMPCAGDPLASFCGCPPNGICGNGAAGGCGNSTSATTTAPMGFGGWIQGTGSTSVGSDNLTLTVSNIPVNQFGLIFMAQTQVGSVFGDGLRCVGGPTTTRFSIQNSGPSGMIVETNVVGVSQGFPPASQISNGQTWNFQGWFRDPTGPCGTAFNVTNAVTATFTL